MSVPVARPLAVLAATALCATAAGCGAAASDKNSATSFSGDQRAVATTIETLQDKAKDSDEAAICRDVLATSFVRAITAHGKDACPAALRKSLRDANSTTFELQVKKVSITGNRATATVVSEVKRAADRAQTFLLLREGGRWKLAAISR